MAGSKKEFKSSRKCENCGLWFRSQTMWAHHRICKPVAIEISPYVNEVSESAVDQLLNSAYEELQRRRDVIVTDIQRLESLKDELAQVESKLNKLGEIIDKKAVPAL